jgi:hypothetical protein
VRQDVALVASVPLTDELWEPLAEGELIALSNGLCHGADGLPTTPERLGGVPRSGNLGREAQKDS